MRKIITEQIVEDFRRHLVEEEKSASTVGKYVRDVRAFARWCAGRARQGASTEVDKGTVTAWKAHLVASGYAPRSVNSMLASLNSLFRHMGWRDCAARFLRVQRQACRPESRDLTREGYERLCRAARRRGDERAELVMRTLCATGMRVGELRFVTAEAVRAGHATVAHKGKVRTVALVGALRRRLERYMQGCGITAGPVFAGRHGTPVHRSTVWRWMKSLAREAGVSAAGSFPHNLRHLFAREFYRQGRDLAGLADVLGHSSVDTTRVYLARSASEHLRLMEALRLVV